MPRKWRVKCLLGLVVLVVMNSIISSVFILINSRLHRDKSKDFLNNRVSSRSNIGKKEVRSIYYRLSSDIRYHYEFRFQFNPSINHHLMLILNGANRACRDLWDFSVGTRILTSIDSFGYSILALCSARQTYDIDLPIATNKDAKYIYLALQKWMKTIYYPRYKRYPLLYIHATSRGSKFAGILSRILPIQAQILYSFPGHREAMLIPSIYDIEMQTRLILDPIFANWFYFDFCARTTTTTTTKTIINQTLCPFQNTQNSFYPLPPTYFTYLKNDPYQKEEIYQYFLQELGQNSLHLGGILLTNSNTIQLDILFPVQPNVTYMQEKFHPWHDKPHAAQWFFEHFTHPLMNRQHRTCWCIDIDLKYFERLPQLMKTWPGKKQMEYHDYVRDIRRYEHAFCEEVCGDLLATHAMVSRNINRTLTWINQIDQLRRSLYIKDYLQRPLRIWMYEKKFLTNHSEPNWANLSKEFQMYASEYYIQDDFQQSRAVHHRLFQWTRNPLLADYFLIPSDLMFFYFSHRPSTLNDSQFNQLLMKLNKDYFHRLLTNIRTQFPYWRLARTEDQQGANHILTIPGGRNMGILFNQTQKFLKNVIQLVYTGIREDFLSQYSYRGLHLVYRHHYDVVIPQFTPLNIKRNKVEYLDHFVQQKKRLFYFAGNLRHSISFYAARTQLFRLWQEMKEKQQTNMVTKIQGKEFDTLEIIDGHIKPEEYIQSIQFSVFSLCPEGFLPWSPRLYESIQIGAIPIILADNIVLPFERFIDWRSFTVKINVSHLRNITDIVSKINHFEEYIKDKLRNALPYFHAFRWPYVVVQDNLFQSESESNERNKDDVFYYLALELRCRRLEQWYGLTVNTSTSKSIEAQRRACTNHPTICPCYHEQRSLAFQQYL